MNISYEKSKSLKDKNPKFKKYPRINKNRFTRNLLNLFNLLDPRTPLQMVSKQTDWIKGSEKITQKLENIKNTEDTVELVVFSINKIEITIFSINKIEIIQKEP